MSQYRFVVPPPTTPLCASAPFLAFSAPLTVTRVVLAEVKLVRRNPPEFSRRQ